MINKAIQKNSNQPPVPLRLRNSGSEIGGAWAALIDEEAAGAGAAAAAVLEGMDDDDGLRSVTSFCPQLMQNSASSEFPAPHFMQYMQFLRRS